MGSPWIGAYLGAPFPWEQLPSLCLGRWTGAWGGDHPPSFPQGNEMGGPLMPSERQPTQRKQKE